MDRIRKSTRLSTWLYTDQNSLLESNRESKVIRKLKMLPADCLGLNTVCSNPVRGNLFEPLLMSPKVQ